MNRITMSAAMILIAAGWNALAARPLVTEDASILDPKACQMEYWMHESPDSRRYWVAPACNPWSEGGAELSIGAARRREAGGTFQSELMLQAKTLFRPTETNDWGAGLVAGTVKHRQLEGSREWYVTVPLSLSTYDDKLMWHANVGWLREQDTRKDLGIWALAVEGQVTGRFTVLAEVFGLHEGNPSYQLGFRFELAPRVLVDATYGNSFGSEDKSLSVGVHIETPPFLP